jgi:2-polyprenyl-6-methoxyphenol hydroxylase-like FAD-dependent oxidoreductase
MKIAIIGAGSVGTNLHHAFALKGVRTELVHARPLTDEKTSEEAIKQLPTADVYIYTVADHALREVVAVVHAPKALHLHTSGTMPIEVFGEDKPHAGVFYFLQSFSRTKLMDECSSIP